MKRLLLAVAVVILVSGKGFSEEGKKMGATKKILVVYYSKTGNTERVAKEVAAALNADLEKVIDRKDRSGIFGFLTGGRDGMKKKMTDIDPPKKNPADYDLVILSTPVWGGDMTPAIRTYVAMNKTNLNAIACIITAGRTRAEKVVPSFAEAAGKRPVAYVGFVSKELKNEAVYKEKLAKFIEELKK
jgi:flavodoxin